MTGRRREVLVAAVVLATLLVAGWLFWGGRRHASDETPGSETSGPEQQGPEVRVTLYFPSLSDRRLHGEEHSIPQASRQDQVRGIVEALLSGPRSPMLVPPLPAGVELAGIFLGDDGVAYVDLRQEGRDQPPAFGSSQETLAVFSLVDSVALNTPGVESVALLWNGSQPSTFSGHLDTARPLRPNRKLLAESP